EQSRRFVAEIGRRSPGCRRLLKHLRRSACTERFRKRAVGLVAAPGSKRECNRCRTEVCGATAVHLLQRQYRELGSRANSSSQSQTQSTKSALTGDRSYSRLRLL